MTISGKTILRSGGPLVLRVDSLLRRAGWAADLSVEPTQGGRTLEVELWADGREVTFIEVDISIEKESSH